MKKILLLLSIFTITLTLPLEGHALKHWQSRKKKNEGLEAVCPSNKIRQIGSEFFWKNNKPIRDTSRPGAPVVGNNPVMTLAGQPGKGRGLFNRSGSLYAINGQRITGMTPYPCRSDHCGGRVVSSLRTEQGRRAAIKAAKSPAGYVKIGEGVCVYIPDIGGCFGNGVDKSRPLCDRILK